MSSVQSEGGVLRFVFILSSISPVFFVSIFQTPKFVDQFYWSLTFSVLFLFPNLLMGLRWILAKRKNLTSVYNITKSEDGREHVFTYLFALIIPFFSEEIDSLFKLISFIFLMVFVVFIFWHMRLHYLNLIFALAGYKVLNIRVRSHPGAHSSVAERRYILLSKDEDVEAGERLRCVRLSNHILMYDGEQNGQ